MKKFVGKVCSSPSAISLIVFNLLVLVVATNSSLQLVHILLIYLIEVFIVIFISLSKIIIAKLFLKEKKISLKKSSFLYIFSFFWFILYYPFIIGLNIPTSLNLFPSNEIFIAFIFSIFLLFLSHLISLIVNFKKDNKQFKLQADYFLVSRMLVFHFAIIFGVFLGAFFGNFGLGVVIVFILCKLVVDLPAHLSLHSNYA